MEKEIITIQQEITLEYTDAKAKDEAIAELLKGTNWFGVGNAQWTLSKTDKIKIV